MDERDHVGEHTSEERGDPGVVGSTVTPDEFASDEAALRHPEPRAEPSQRPGA